MWVEGLLSAPCMRGWSVTFFHRRLNHRLNIRRHLSIRHLSIHRHVSCCYCRSMKILN